MEINKRLKISIKYFKYSQNKLESLLFIIT